MKRTCTIAWLTCMLLATVVQVHAQPVRNGVDVIWAKDVAGAELTLDGVIDEAVWQQAETLQFEWNGEHPLPGGGQVIDGQFTPAEPTDPVSATVYLLRDGNDLWLAADVQDASVGGGNLWAIDGLVMNLMNVADIEANRFNDHNFFVGNRGEFFITWWNGADTTDATTTFDNGELVGSGLPLPGIGPRFHNGIYGQPNNVGTIPERPDSLVEVWDAVTIVDGIANDDTHGEDVGYVIEMRLDMSALGYDFTQPDGDKAFVSMAIRDTDYQWPADTDLNFRSAVYWQNYWGNNYNEGVGYILGAPDVTVAGEAPEVTEPEFTVRSGELFEAPEIDGALDEDVWERVDPSFSLQYQADEDVRAVNPDLAEHWMNWFRPQIGGQITAPIVDPSRADVYLFFRDETLYLGVDVNDQAISGLGAENGMDGYRFFIRARDTLDTGGSLLTRIFELTVDSVGTLRVGGDIVPLTDANPDAVQAALHLKGASTAADPSDIDEGYQFEVAIDLVDALGYSEDLDDRKIWVAMNYFDGDFLDTEEASYATRTWILNERAANSASIYGYLDPENPIGTAAERPSEMPNSIVLEGNYPNPFNPSTTLRYALPAGGDVAVQVFDMLGREVARYAAGFQSAGRNEFSLDASHLASGMYVYRLNVSDVATGAVQSSAVGQMVLIK